MKDKNPILAGLLNLVFPGLGAAYTGEWKYMASEFLEIVLFLLFWIFGALLVGLLENSQSLLYYNVGFLVLYGLAMFFDGKEAAQIHNRKTQTQ